QLKRLVLKSLSRWVVGRYLVAFYGQKYFGCGWLYRERAWGPVQPTLGSRPYPQGPFQESRNARSAIAIKSICCLSQQNKQADQQTVKRAMAVGHLHRAAAQTSHPAPRSGPRRCCQVYLVRPLAYRTWT